MSEQQLPVGAAAATPAPPAPPAAGGVFGRGANPAAELIARLGLPAGRTLAIILAAAVALTALIFTLTLMDSATYRVVYPDLAKRDVAAVITALEAAGIPATLAEGSGNVQVPADRLDEARVKLAGQGLPRGSGAGMEFINKQGALGSSRFIDEARFRQALEAELARSIQWMSAIDSARVHLAQGRRSPFLQEKIPPTASVVVKLFPGRVLDEGTAAAITHMVATAVSGLKTDSVSIVDQNGRLMSNNRDAASQYAATKIGIQRKVETKLVEKIRSMIAPMVGLENVHAQTTVDIDFTRIERTEEKYDENERPQIRSEQVTRRRGTKDAAQGVPGALTNEPAATPGEGGAGGIPGGDDASLTDLEYLRNYELDKVISHIVNTGGGIKRLSASVLVDHVATTAADGTVTRAPLSPEQLEKVTQLVRGVVNFNAERGDNVTVVNEPFVKEDLTAAVEWWKEPWFLSVVKLGTIALLALLLLFMVVRPLLKALTRPPAEGPAAAKSGSRLSVTDSAAELEALESPERETPYAIGGDVDPFPELDTPLDYQSDIRLAQRVAASDPRRAAQVIRRWLEHAA